MSEIFVQGSLKEFQNDGDDADRYYLPARAVSLGLGRPGSQIILPDTPETRIYYQQMSQIASLNLFLTAPQAIFVPDTHYLLDEAVMASASYLSDQLENGQPHQVWPYSNTQELQDWVARLNQDGHNLSIALPPRQYYENLRHPQHRGGWARWISDPGQQSFPEKYDLPYPVAYAGEGISEISAAYTQVVAETGNENVYFKPVFSAGGFTLKKISSLPELHEHYEQIKATGSLDLFGQEMPVEMQAEIQGITGFISVQYLGDKLITPGGFSRQQVRGNNWEGNSFNTNSLSPESVATVQDIFAAFSRGMANETAGDFYGWGGLDLAVIKGDRDLEDVVIIEHNGGRMTGAHPAIAMSRVLGVADQPFSIRKVSGVNSELKDVWELYSKNKIGYDPQTGSGSIPLLWLAGSGFVFSTAETESQMQQNLDSGLDMAISQGLLGI